MKHNIYISKSAYKDVTIRVLYNINKISLHVLALDTYMSPSSDFYLRSKLCQEAP